MAQRNTKQRQMILEAVRSRCDHPTADEIYLQVRSQDSRISRGTVYRNLGVLVQNGEIKHVPCEPADRYDLRLDRHHHMRCISCGQVWDAPIAYEPAYDEQLETITGFKVMYHEIMSEGLCSACQSQAN